MVWHTESVVSAAWGLDSHLTSQLSSSVPATMANQRRTCTAGQKNMWPNSTAKVRRWEQNQRFSSTWWTPTEENLLKRTLKIILKFKFWKPTKNLSPGSLKKAHTYPATKVSCWTPKTSGIKQSWSGQRRKSSKEEHSYCYGKEEEEKEASPWAEG